jgi:hypothetical protein
LKLGKLGRSWLTRRQVHKTIFKSARAGRPVITIKIHKTMTRSAEELSRDEHLDMKVLLEYIKNYLFPKAKFVYGRDDWDVGGRICNDYIKCCKGQVGLQTMTEVDRERHMEKIWMRALNKKIQKKSLVVQKKSAIYTVMQNKFTGE